MSSCGRPATASGYGVLRDLVGAKRIAALKSQRGNRRAMDLQTLDELAVSLSFALCPELAPRDLVDGDGRARCARRVRRPARTERDYEVFRG